MTNLYPSPNQRKAIKKADQDLAKRIDALEGIGDIESAHGTADGILTELVQSLGFVKTAEAFEALTKWYA